MFSFIAFLIAAVFFLFAAIGEQISDWNMTAWGLFFTAVGLLLSHGFGSRADRDRF